MKNGSLTTTVVVIARGSGPDGGQDRIDGQEGFAVCLVELARNHLLRAAPLWPNAQFGPLLPTTEVRELGWEVLMHPPYSPDLVPSDYHLFLSMANAFNGEKLASRGL